MLFVSVAKLYFVANLRTMRFGFNRTIYGTLKYCRTFPPFLIHSFIKLIVTVADANIACHGLMAVNKCITELNARVKSADDKNINCAENNTSIVCSKYSFVIGRTI